MLLSKFRSFEVSSLQLYWLCIILVVTGLILFLGVQPFFLEEPRRAFVAMELVANDNYWVPTQLGQLYYNKPPFFNWVLISMAYLFGGFSEWVMRLPTVLSTIGIGVLVYFMGKKYYSQFFGFEAGLLTITSAGIFFYFSTLAEIDLFYSFITVGIFFSIYHFDQEKKPYLLFLTVYLLTTIGFLTKALPSLVFTALSLLTYYIYEKRFRMLFHPAHFLGIFLFLFLGGGYYYIYAQYQDPMPFLTRLFGESSNRTIAGSGLLEFLQHLLNFPLNTWIDLLPAGLMVVFLFRKDIYELINKDPYIKFCFWIGIINLLVYWISPGSRQRYVYMLYPLFINVLLSIFYEYQGKMSWQYRLFRALVIFIGVVLGLGMLVLNFIPALAFISYLPIMALIGLPLFWYITYLIWKWKLPLIQGLILLTALGRIAFDLAILPQRAHDSGAQDSKEIAAQIHEIVKDEALHFYWPEEDEEINEFDISFVKVYYLNLLREDVLRHEVKKIEGHYYIAKLKDLEDIPHESLLSFTDFDESYALIRFSN